MVAMLTVSETVPVRFISLAHHLIIIYQVLTLTKLDADIVERIMT